MSFHTIAIWGSSLAFLSYGALCLTNLSMESEFKRFGLEHLRTLTGSLEVLGGIGLLVGLRWPFALRFSSAGLMLLMIAGLAVRIRAGDGWILSLQAFALMLLNGYILFKSLN